MDRYKIPKEYEDAIKIIEDKTEKYISPYLAQALLREVTENTAVENPMNYTSRFMDELKGKSFYFIKEITRQMLLEAEMYCNLQE